MTANDVKLRIGGGVDSVTKRRPTADRPRRNVFVVRRGFFYRHGLTATTIVDRVRLAFPTAIILDSGEVDRPFNGASPIERSSHWWVEFQIPEPE